MRRRSGRAIASDPTADLIAWQGSIRIDPVDERSYPVMRSVLVPPGELLAGMRTQPVVQKRPIRDGHVAHRVHEPIRQEIPTGAPAVRSSAFQPTLLHMRGWFDSTSTDWNWPARFSGLWARVGLLAVPTPGGAQQQPAPRFTRVLRVPRFSTLPPEMTPVTHA